MSNIKAICTLELYFRTLILSWATPKWEIFPKSTWYLEQDCWSKNHLQPFVDLSDVFRGCPGWCSGTRWLGSECRRWQNRSGWRKWTQNRSPVLRSETLTYRTRHWIFHNINAEILGWGRQLVSVVRTDRSGSLLDDFRGWGKTKGKNWRTLYFSRLQC